MISVDAFDAGIRFVDANWKSFNKKFNSLPKNAGADAAKETPKVTVA